MLNLKKKKSLYFTDSAVLKVKDLIINSKSNIKLRICVVSGGCNGFKYGFFLDSNINTNDFIFKKNGAIFIIDLMSLQYLFGSSIDYIEELNGSRFIVLNPNIKYFCGCGLSFNIN